MTEQTPRDEQPEPGEETTPEPGGPAPTTPASTGVPAADSAADRLAELESAPLEEHVGIYEDVHRRLQEGLADLDEQ